jgi:hypothetical protein
VIAVDRVPLLRRAIATVDRHPRKVLRKVGQRAWEATPG